MGAADSRSGGGGGCGGGGGGGGRAPETAASVVREYARDTTLHGIRYISRPGAPLWDRLCWALAVFVSLGCAAAFIATVWESFRHSPTVTTVENTHYPLHAFPFPAVTVCPANRVRRTVGMELLRRYLKERFSGDELAAMERQLARRGYNYSLDEALLDVLSVLSFYQHPFFYRMESFLDRADPILPYFRHLNISEFMLQVLPPCESVFGSCFWHGNTFNCCAEFRLQRTECGFCYAYNSLTAEHVPHCPRGLGLRPGLPPAGQPRGCRARRNTAVGILSGLELFMGHPPASEQLPPPGRQRDSKGFRVIIDHPSNLPEGGNDLFVPSEPEKGVRSVFNAKISPSSTTATAALKGLALPERGCYFPDERRLAIARTYTLQNCMLECRQRYLASACGCRTFFFKRIDSDAPEMKECDITQLKCIQDSSVGLRYSRVPPESQDPDEENSPLDCSGCLPTCDDMKYVVDFGSAHDTNPLIYNASAYMDFYYRSDSAIKYRMDVAFGDLQLLVSFGGIMSLFLGVSLLSGVELLYYVIRLVLAVCRGRRSEDEAEVFEGRVRRPRRLQLPRRRLAPNPAPAEDSWVAGFGFGLGSQLGVSRNSHPKPAFY